MCRMLNTEMHSDMVVKEDSVQMMAVECRRVEDIRVNMKKERTKESPLQKRSGRVQD